jgi:hypothetical protein
MTNLVTGIYIILIRIYFIDKTILFENNHK